MGKSLDLMHLTKFLWRAVLTEMVVSSVQEISAPAIRETFVDPSPVEGVIFYSLLSKSIVLQATALQAVLISWVFIFGAFFGRYIFLMEREAVLRDNTNTTNTSASSPRDNIPHRFRYEPSDRCRDPFQSHRRCQRRRWHSESPGHFVGGTTGPDIARATP